MSTVYGGVETGGTWVVCLLASGPDDVVAEIRFPTTSPEETIEQIGQFFGAHETPAAIGVGAFGPIGVSAGSGNWGVLQNTPKPGWAGFALGPELQRRTGVRVVLDTDVNAAALAEQRWGAAIGAQNVAYLTVGTGIGAGFVVDGQPLHGLLHPEAGHIRIPHDWLRDPFSGCCPSHGDCWEGLAAGSAMEARWQTPGALLADEHPGWELEADYLAAGIANIIAIVSPQRFIVGGGVFRHPGLIELVRTRIRTLLAGYLDAEELTTGLDRYLVPPGLAGRSGSLGAIAIAMDATAERERDPDPERVSQTRTNDKGGVGQGL